jgi:hypothetical protein
MNVLRTAFVLLALSSVAVLGKETPKSIERPMKGTSAKQETATTKTIEALLLEFLARVDDPAMHDRFWADDLVYTSAKAEVRTKKEIMDRMRAAPAADAQAARTRYDAEEILVRDFDHTAALTFRLIAKNPDGTTLRFRNSGTFILREGQWQVVTWQATPEQ